MPENNTVVSHRIAVLIPCYNESLTVVSVIKDFKKELPGVEIHVFDNNSTDNTVELALEAGALVTKVPYQGKGNVVKRMFAEVEADIYLLVDGDATYDAPSCHAMINSLIENGLDMAVGCREQAESGVYRPGHQFGNIALSRVVEVIFGQPVKDMLSGYRVFSRRYVKSFPCVSKGFEIETEMSVHACQMRLPVGEIVTPYYTRPENSISKLNTYRDGWRVLCTIFSLFMFERPRFFFGIIWALLLTLAFILALPIFIAWINTGLVPRFPTAILCSALATLAFLMLVFGNLLDASRRSRQACIHMAYLSYPGPKKTRA